MVSSDQEATDETAEALGLAGGQRTSPEALQEGMQDAIERVRGSQAQGGEDAAGDQAEAQDRGLLEEQASRPGQTST